MKSPIPKERLRVSNWIVQKLLPNCEGKMLGLPTARFPRVPEGECRNCYMLFRHRPTILLRLGRADRGRWNSGIYRLCIRQSTYPTP